MAMLIQQPAALLANSRVVPNQGMGYMGMGALPFGLFASGTDYSQWTWKEWAVIGVGGWFLLKRK